MLLLRVRHGKSALEVKMSDDATRAIDDVLKQAIEDRDSSVVAIIGLRDSFDEINKTLKEIDKTLQEIGSCLDR